MISSQMILFDEKVSFKTNFWKHSKIGLSSFEEISNKAETTFSMYKIGQRKRALKKKKNMFG